MKKLLIVLGCLLLVGCSSSAKTEAAYVTDSVYEESTSYSTGSYDNGYQDAMSDEKEYEERETKLIYEANVSVETKEFQESLDKLYEKIKECGGYVLSDSMNNYSRKSSNLTIRIPQENFDKFMKDSEELGNVTHSSISAQDVTDYYYDTEARLHNYEVQEERLLELLDIAESLEDIMAIEARLSDVRYQIESYTGQLKTLDKRVTYATIYMDIYEVVTYQTVTFGSRFVEACKDTWLNALEFVQELIIACVYLLPFVLMAGIVLFIFKQCKKFIKLPKFNLFKKKKSE